MNVFAKPVMALLLSAATLACVSCVTAPEVRINRGVSSCSELVPETWFEGVPHAEFPANPEELGDWVLFGTQESRQLDTSNTRFTDGFAIVKKCEARDKEVYDSLTRRPWLSKFTPWRELPTELSR